MPQGAVTLADIRSQFQMLEVRCGKCPRRGRLHVDQLIAKHGHDMGLPELRTILAGDCEHNNAAAYHDRCKVFYPQLKDFG